MSWEWASMARQSPREREDLDNSYLRLRIRSIGGFGGVLGFTEPQSIAPCKLKGGGAMRRTFVPVRHASSETSNAEDARRLRPEAQPTHPCVH